MTIPFTPWPKTPRLNRDMVITEKIDGTNAAIVVLPLDAVDHIRHEDGEIEFFQDDSRNMTAVVTREITDHRPGTFVVFVQSRNRFITPGKATDNAGFAGWVKEHAELLVQILGPGHHYGEWWGSGIQRAYGLTGGEKRFSLFNTHRWGTYLSATEDVTAVPGLRVVPVLYRGLFDQNEIERVLGDLDLVGSAAAPGFPHPEGVIVYLAAAGTSFKVMLENDDKPKGQVAA